MDTNKLVLTSLALVLALFNLFGLGYIFFLDADSNPVNPANKFSLSGILLCVSVVLVVGKAALYAFKLNEHRTGSSDSEGGFVAETRHGTGSLLLALSAMGLGIVDNTEYKNFAIVYLLSNCVDRIVNMVISTGIAGSVVRVTSGKMRRSRIIGTLVLLGGALAGLIMAKIDQPMEGDQDTYSWVAFSLLIIHIVVATCSVLAILDLGNVEVVALSEYPLVRSIVAGSHLIFMCINFGVLYADNLDNSLLSLAVAAVVLADIMGRNLV
jgi:hypothetical protein